MKDDDDTLLEYAESPRLALWTAVAIALGLILHRIFFLFAGILVLIAPLSWLLEWLRKHEQSTALPRH